MLRTLLVVLLGGAVSAAAEQAKLPGQEVVARRTTSKDLALPVERWVAANGLVVLFSPDASAHQVVVDLTFNAGALYEPEQKSGLAHLTEHALSSGDTPETNYQAMLEARGALDFNGSTTPDRLTWHVVVPPEELPLALWANADRLGTLPALVTAEGLARHRRIVLQERLLRLEDAAYGKSQIAMMARLFPAGHPLHLGVFGTPTTLERITPDDVRTFASTLLVAKNAVLTVSGKFEPQVAREWIERTVGRLPSGAPAEAPAATPPLRSNMKVMISEAIARRPRVTFAWPLAQPLEEMTEALSFGALLLSIYADGFIGMNVAANVVEFRDGALFVLDVTMPHAVDMQEAGGNAEVVYRFLASTLMPPDLVAATFHAIDRLYLTTLASPVLRASLLTELERHPPNATPGYLPTERHWRLTPISIQTRAAIALKGGRLILQVRPTRPLPKREPRE